MPLATLEATIRGDAVPKSQRAPPDVAVMILAVTMLLTASPAVGATADDGGLASVLKLAGESEQRKSDTPCGFTENSEIEQVTSDGKVEGKVVRQYTSTVKDAVITSRTLVSKKIEGDPSSKMSDEQKPITEPQYSAFHPKRQPLYRYELLASDDAARAKVKFTPLKPNEKLMTGTAVINRATGLVERLEGTPSELPTLLQDFQMTMTQTETACGPQMTRFSMKGTGGLLFIKMRFRGVTTLTGHQRQ